LPARAVAAAVAVGEEADTFYSLELLRETVIVTVPGSGFGQMASTWHFRVTFLPPEDQIDMVVEKLTLFHASFLSKYRGADEL
jgi:alanine transaminase